MIKGKLKLVYRNPAAVDASGPYGPKNQYHYEAPDGTKHLVQAQTREEAEARVATGRMLRLGRDGNLE